MGDPVGGILGCAHKKNDQCVGVRITNNVVSTVEPSDVDTFGYSVMGHECGNYQDIVFRDNVAHSIHGYGAIIFKNESDKGANYFNCIEASYFTAYKCSKVGIVSNQAVNNVIFSNMILIDNGISAIASIGIEGDLQTSNMNNIKFYGETEVKDCKV